MLITRYTPRRGMFVQHGVPALLVATLLLFSLAPISAKGSEAGLVAYWSFDEGRGDVAKDRSGKGNDGKISGATFVESPQGHALRFDGTDDFVDCGAGPGFRQLESAGTIDFWFKPEEFQGGLVNWAGKEGAFILGFNTYRGAPVMGEFFMQFSQPNRSQDYNFDRPEKGAWAHCAFTFDGSAVTYYLDGVVRQVFQQQARPRMADAPLWLGKGGIGNPFYRGVIDEVRIHSRVLSPLEILADYKTEAPSFGKETKYFNTPQLTVQAMPEPGWIAVEVDFALLRPLPAGSALVASVLDADGSEKQRKVQAISSEVSSSTATIDATALALGNYQVKVSIHDGQGREVTKPISQNVAWSGQAQEFRGVKILNNLVWELLKMNQKTIKETGSFTFKSPKRRWVHIVTSADATAGKMGVSIDGSKEIITFSKGEQGTKEVMRFLEPGAHTLVVQSEGAGHIKELVVRSIPELLFHRFFGLPQGDLNNTAESFFEKYIINNVNTFTVSPGLWDNPKYSAFWKKWEASGRRWIVPCRAEGTPAVGDKVFSTGQQAYDYMSTTSGFTNDIVHGSIVDEFPGSCGACPAYAEAIRKLKATAPFKDKLFYTFETTLDLRGNGEARVNAMLDTDAVLVRTRYLPTQRSEFVAREFVKQELVGEARKFRKLFPRGMEHLAVCFGNFSAAGGHLLNSPPGSHKAYLDIQFNLVANDPVFWGTYGIMTYHISHGDEETVRWISHLFRHYGIEGRVDPATSDPYISPHLVNGDFDRGADGWDTEPAESNSIRTVLKHDHSWMENRYRSSAGDTGLVMTRSPKHPNKITQQIRNLEPGKLYTFRMISSDYENLAKEEKHAIRVSFDHVNVLPEKSFTQLFYYDGNYPPYDTDKNKAWLNYHWYLFRANGENARVTVTDWKSETESGGPMGQQIICNFAQVHPYFPAEGQ